MLTDSFENFEKNKIRNAMRESVFQKERKYVSFLRYPRYFLKNKHVNHTFFMIWGRGQIFFNRRGVFSDSFLNRMLLTIRKYEVRSAAINQP